MIHDISDLRKIRTDKQDRKNFSLYGGTKDTIDYINKLADENSEFLENRRKTAIAVVKSIAERLPGIGAEFRKMIPGETLIMYVSGDYIPDDGNVWGTPFVFATGWNGERYSIYVKITDDSILQKDIMLSTAILRIRPDGVDLFSFDENKWKPTVQENLFLLPEDLREEYDNKTNLGIFAYKLARLIKYDSEQLDDMHEQLRKTIEEYMPLADVLGLFDGMELYVEDDQAIVAPVWRNTPGIGIGYRDGFFTINQFIGKTYDGIEEKLTNPRVIKSDPFFKKLKAINLNIEKAVGIIQRLNKFRLYTVGKTDDPRKVEDILYKVYNMENDEDMEEIQLILPVSLDKQIWFPLTKFLPEMIEEVAKSKTLSETEKEALEAFLNENERFVEALHI